MKIILIFLCVLFVILQYKLWFSGDGVAKSIALWHKIQIQKAQNDELKERNMSVIKTINNLQKNSSETETIAREQLGMTKKNEVFYRLVERAK